MSKEAKPDLRFPHVRPGSTLRLEIHVSDFCSFTMTLSCAEMGELMRMLMSEAALQDVPASPRHTVQRAFERRDDYRRIKGGLSRRSLSESTRKAVFERDGRTCRYRGLAMSWADYHCDHVEPVSKGGSDALDNLAASCGPCNLAKAAKPLSDWLQ